MCLLNEIQFYKDKILNFEPEFIVDEPKKIINKEIEDLQLCWSKFQTFHNHLMEEAELKSDSFETKAILNENYNKVQKHFESCVNSLKSFLKPPLVRSENKEFLDDDDGLCSTSVGKSIKRKSSQSLEPVSSSNVQAGPSNSELKHRRKTSHKSLLTDANDEITFETYVVPNNEDDDITSKRDTEKTTQPSYKKRKIDIFENDENPNDDLIWNVAFLRSCVNYTMKRLGYKTFGFKRSPSLSLLMSQFYANKNQQGKIFNLKETDK